MASTAPFRLDNVLVTGYTYNRVEETGKDNGIGSTMSPVVPGKTIAVDPNVIPYGSLVVIDGEKYLANDTGAALSESGYTTQIDMPHWSYSEAMQWGRQTKDVVVYPPGNSIADVSIASLKDEYDINDNSSWSDSWLSRQETLSQTQWAASAVKSGLTASGVGAAAVKKNEAANNANTNTSEASVNGAGVSGASAGEKGIIDFASFAESLAFNSKMTRDFNENGEATLHEYLSRFMSKFYHQLYYVPNLKNNFTILVKPETLFINAPSCNVIYPNIKSSLSYSRPYKQEPTRLMQVTDPVAALYNTASSSPSRLVCLMFVDEEKQEATRNGLPIYKTYVTSLGDEHSKLTDKTQPLLNLTNFENRNGIRCSTNNNKGADMWLFLKSSKQKKTNDSGDETYVLTMNSNKDDQVGIGNTMARLARYELLRQRYGFRNGSLECYFNPYIVPGFPFVSFEPTHQGLNVYGYVTDVTHNLTDRSWTTSVNFTCAHGDYEQSPEAFPIVESEYAATIAETYKDMLGDNVTPVTNEVVPTLIDGYNSSNKTVSSSLKKIWRETPTIEEYLEDIADKATIVEDNNFWWFKNGEGSSFFDEELQERLKEYTNDIINRKIAMNNSDVR